MLAVAAVTACAKDEAISLNQEAIDFGAPFVENSTRATDPSFGTTGKPFEKFQVWGTAGDVAIYAGDNVTGSVGLNSVWTCTKQNFWVNGVVYKFAAVANDDANGDKAGVIVGHAGNTGVVVKDCTAENSTVSAGRDAGQIVGAAKEANVTDCSATNVTVTANGEGTGANVRNEVIGRVL